jgi:hypothetical protein
VIATTIPMSTKMTIAACIQIQVGAIEMEAYLGAARGHCRAREPCTTMVLA